MRLRIFFLSVLAFLAACGDAKMTPVTLETELGRIEIEVYNDKAPKSAADFLYYVDNGLYDGEGFYRAVRPETDPVSLSDASTLPLVPAATPARRQAIGFDAQTLLRITGMAFHYRWRMAIAIVATVLAAAAPASASLKNLFMGGLLRKRWFGR